MKAVAVAALLAVLAGCVPPLYEFGWALEFDIPDLGVRTVQDAVAWTARNVHYAWDDGEYWQHPGQTVYFWCVLAVLLVLGSFVFRRLRPHFADVL